MYLVGATYAVVENLVSDMAATLEASMSSGAFASTLSKTALAGHSDLLSQVSYAELVSLEISSIAYSNSHLVYVYSADAESSTVSSSSKIGGFSNGFIIMFVGVAAFAFVAFIGVATHGFNGYSKVRSVTDSEQQMEMNEISLKI